MGCDKLLKFYDIKSKKLFTSSSYKVIEKRGRRFAVTTSPFTGISAW